MGHIPHTRSVCSPDPVWDQIAGSVSGCDLVPVLLCVTDPATHDHNSFAGSGHVLPLAHASDLAMEGPCVVQLSSAQGHVICLIGFPIGQEIWRQGSDN